MSGFVTWSSEVLTCPGKWSLVWWHMAPMPLRFINTQPTPLRLRCVCVRGSVRRTPYALRPGLWAQAQAQGSSSSSSSSSPSPHSNCWGVGGELHGEREVQQGTITKPQDIDISAMRWSAAGKKNIDHHRRPTPGSTYPVVGAGSSLIGGGACRSPW
jgi:hypothetical protein